MFCTFRPFLHEQLAQVPPSQSHIGCIGYSRLCLSCAVPCQELWSLSCCKAVSMLWEGNNLHFESLACPGAKPQLLTAAMPTHVHADAALAPRLDPYSCSGQQHCLHCHTGFNAHTQQEPSSQHKMPPFWCFCLPTLHSLLL